MNMDVSDCCVSNVLVHQDSTAPDGFLSSAEFSVWASTVRLREDEPHPVLKRSQFMSLPADLQPQVFEFSSAIMHLHCGIDLIYETNMHLI